MADSPPVIVMGGIYEVVSYTAKGAQLGLNVFHYRCTATTAPPVRPITEILDALVTSNWPTKLKACMSDQATYVGLSVRQIQPVQSVVYVDKTGLGAGTVSGELLPKQVAGYIRKPSAVAGQRKGGRFYIPFPSEVHNTNDSEPSAAYITVATALAALLGNGLNLGGDTGLDPIIYSRPRPGHAYQWRNMREPLVIAKWATQRRRGDFGRTNILPI